MRHLTAIALSVSLAFATSSAMAKGSPTERVDRKLSEMTQELKLSDSQRDKLRPVLNALEQRKEAERLAAKKYESEQLRLVLTPVQAKAWEDADKKRPKSKSGKKPDTK